MIAHHAHEHPLQQIDPNIVYAQYEGKWKCDNCDHVKTRTCVPYHCSTCAYDICESCLQPREHVRHNRPLYYTNMMKIFPQYNGSWKCDACGEVKGPPLDPCAYHCYQDQFDMCQDCFRGRLTKVHRHLLIPADAALLYRDYTAAGSWQCDICGKSGHNLGTKFSWHCSPCKFDCCEECRRDIRIEEHGHPLSIRDSLEIYQHNNGAWKCDICGEVQTPMARAPGVTGVDDRYPFHCDVCHQFDACKRCIRGIDEHGPSHAGRLRERIPNETRSEKRFKPPVEVYEDDGTSIDGLSEAEICCVCLQRPRVATLVHQGTGHHCCCMRCAYEIRNRDNRCPLCRREIDDVVKNYNS